MNSRLLVGLILTCISFVSIAFADDEAPSTIRGHETLHFKDVPLLEAIDKGDLDQVKKLVNNGASIEIELINGMKPIHVAAATGNTAIAEFLLDSGAEVNSMSNKGITPLILALDAENMDMIKLFISRGALYTGQDVYGAIYKDNLDIVKLLVTSPALANLSGRRNITLLHVAAMVGRPDIVQYLIGQGARVDAKTSDGETPLDLAMRNKERLSGLLDHGVSRQEILGQGFNYDGYEKVISILKNNVSQG